MGLLSKLNEEQTLVVKSAAESLITSFIFSALYKKNPYVYSTVSLVASLIDSLATKIFKKIWPEGNLFYLKELTKRALITIFVALSASALSTAFKIDIFINIFTYGLGLCFELAWGREISSSVYCFM